MADRGFRIATMNEGPLHAALKAWYAQPGDLIEAAVDGRQIDLVRGNLLIEIQTTGLGALRKKLRQLLENHHVRLVHPVAERRWVARVEGQPPRVLGRRKSPRLGKPIDAFAEFVSLAELLAHPRLSVEILLTHEEEVRRHVPGRAWRRKGWVTVERRLVAVAGRRLIRQAGNLLEFLPAGIPRAFTTSDLAEQLQISRDLAQKVAYCLRHAGVIRQEGKQGNARIYRAAA